MHGGLRKRHYFSVYVRKIIGMLNDLDKNMINIRFFKNMLSIFNSHLCSYSSNLLLF